MLYTMFLPIVYGQSNDILLTKSGIRNKGTFERIVNKTIYFKYEKQDEAWKVDKTLVDSILIGDMHFINLSTGKKEYTKHVLENISQLQLKAIEEKKKQVLEKNSKIKYLVIPLKDDKHGRTEEYIEYYKTLGYNVVSNYFALEYLENNKIELENLNDYHIIKMGEKLEVDFITYGYLFTIKEDFIFSQNPEVSAREQAKALGVYSADWLAQYFDQKKDEYELEAFLNARNYAGTYIYETIFEIEINSKKKNFVRKNLIAKKF